MAATRDSLLRQAGWRLGLVVLATLLVVGGASVAFYYAALGRAADVHAESLAGFYQGRLRQLEGHWEREAVKLKNLLELSRALESPAGLAVGTESFLTQLGEESGFENVQIDGDDDRLLFKRGATLIEVPPESGVDAPPHWHYDRQSQTLHRVYSMPIWLGADRGTGHLHWYVPMDNGLLHGMASLDSELYLLWNGRVVAGSTGAEIPAAELAGRRTVIEDERLSIQRGVDWGNTAEHPLLVVRHHLPRPISSRELWAAISVTFGFMLVALALVLGRWLLGTAQRMAWLTRASQRYHRSMELTPAVAGALAEAGREGADEIRQMANALDDLLRRVDAHKRERDERESALHTARHRLAEAQEIAGLCHFEADLASRQILMNDQFFRVHRLSAEAVGGYALGIDEFSARFLHPEDTITMSGLVGDCMADNDPARTYEAENRFVCGDGKTRWTRVRFRLERNADGSPRRLLGTAEDIQERREREQELKEQAAALADAERRLSEALELAGLAHWELDLAQMRFTLNDQFYRVYRTTAAAEGGHELGVLDYVARFLCPEDAPQVERNVARAIADNDPAQTYHDEARVCCGDGVTRWIAVRFQMIRGEDGRPRRLRGTIQDIDELKQAEARLRLMATVFENSGEAILITDAKNAIIAVNPAFTLLTGYPFEDVRGRNPRLLSAGRTSAEEYESMWRAIRERGFWRGEIWDRRRDGSVYPKWLAITAVANSRGRVVNYIASFSDITEHKLAEERIKHLAHHDALTGLPNRFSLQSRLAQAVAAAQRKRQGLAVMFIDLDRFKTINDTLGHHVGDELLIGVARRLQQCVRASDIVARLGGDEFVVALTEVESPADAAHLAEMLLRVLATPHQIEGHELHTTPSIGISLFPEDSTDEDTLMKNADIAMYHAKSAGRNNYQFFTPSMNQAAVERHALETALRQALERQEYLLHYQPQIDMRTGRVSGVEALVRWRRQENELVAPNKFIPILEDTGLIVPVGEWVLTTACRELRRWQEAGIAGVQMAVNLSARQFRQKGLAESVAGILRAAGLRPEQLELEITETVAMGNPEETIDTLRRLKAMGVMLAIDDFGTGYSSLNYLKLFPINRLKLDRSFVADIETDPNDAAICAATIALAHNLGLDVVAEGVESEAQADYLRRLDCDFVQGFLYCRPQPGETAREWIAGRSGR